MINNDPTPFTKFRAIVVDDEPLPRAHLTHLLREAGVGEVLQADSAVACLELCQAQWPDWVFLDVRMPGMDGMALADVLGTGKVGATRMTPPAIVFATGYEDYALPAFDRAAVDYLLKPVERGRLDVTLKRLAGLGSSDKTAHPLAPPALERLPIRMDYSVRLVDIDDIVAALAEKKRVDVITRDARFSTYYTLAELEQRLPGDRFIRVHDAWIVAIAEIVEVHNLGSQKYQLRLRTGDLDVPVSRRRYGALRERLGI